MKNKICVSFLIMFLFFSYTGFVLIKFPTVKAYTPSSCVLTHQYSFENDLTDSIGNADLTGYKAGYTSSLETDLGQAFDLNGTSYAYNDTLLDDINTGYSSQGISFVVWVKITSSATRRIFDKKLDNIPNNKVDLYISGRKIYFAVKASGTQVYVNNPTALSTDKWYLIVAVIASNSDIFLYTSQGYGMSEIPALVDSDTGLSVFPSDNGGTGSNFTVGCRTTFDYLYDKPIDELRIYNGTISIEDMRNMFWDEVIPSSGTWTTDYHTKILNGETLIVNGSINTDYSFTVQNNVNLTVYGDLISQVRSTNQPFLFEDSWLYVNGSIHYNASPKFLNITNCIVYYANELDWRTGQVNLTDTYFYNLTNTMGHVWLNNAYINNITIQWFAHNQLTALRIQNDVTLYNSSFYIDLGRNLYLENIDNGLIDGLNLIGQNHSAILMDCNNTVVKNVNVTMGNMIGKGDSILKVRNDNNYGFNNSFENVYLNGGSGTTPHFTVYLEEDTNSSFEDLWLEGCDNGLYAINNTLASFINLTITSETYSVYEAFDGGHENFIIDIDESTFILGEIGYFSLEGNGTLIIEDSTITTSESFIAWLEETDLFLVRTELPIGIVGRVKDIYPPPDYGSLPTVGSITQKWNFTDNTIYVQIFSNASNNIWQYETDEIMQSAEIPILSDVTFTSPTPQDQNFEFVIYASKNVSTITVYCGSLGEPTSIFVNGLEYSNYTYSSLTNVVTLILDHDVSQTKTVNVFWSTSASKGFVLASIFLLMFIGIPLTAILWRKQR